MTNITDIHTTNITDRHRTNIYTYIAVLQIKYYSIHDGFGGLVVNMLTKAVGFFGPKNPQHAFLRRGSKRICPMSQLCGMSKNLVIYVNYGLLAKFQV